MRKVYADRQPSKGSIAIGFQGENDTVAVVFDVEEWQRELGPGSVACTLVRPDDVYPYPVVVEVEGSEASWKVRDVDVAKPGFVRCQLDYLLGERVAKSRIYRLYVSSSITCPTPPPEPYQDACDEVKKDAARAEQAMKAAHGSADRAAGEAETAEAWAVGTRDGKPVVPGDPANGQDAKTHAGASLTARRGAEEARAAAEAAQAKAAESEKNAAQSAAQAGYMHFEIDDAGHLIYNRTQNVDVDFKLQEGRLILHA